MASKNVCKKEINTAKGTTDNGPNVGGDGLEIRRNVDHGITRRTEGYAGPSTGPRRGTNEVNSTNEGSGTTNGA